MSSSLYSGVSGLALGAGLYRDVSGLWGGASGFINGFGTSYSPEAAAYFAAMSVQPSDARKAVINTCINAIVAAGVWAKLDWLSLMAAHDAQAARLNAVNPAQAMTAVNAPTFTTDRGYTGDGATSYLDTNWNQTTASSPNYTQNSIHIGSWITSEVSASGQWDLGTLNLRLVSRATGNGTYAVGSSVSSSFALPSATSIGHQCGVRTASNAIEGYKNGVSVGTNTTTSQAPHNGDVFVGAYSNLTTPTGYSTRRIGAVHWGGQLTAAQVLALYNALATYMTAVGA